MANVLRPMGPNDATLPIPTGMVQGFIRNGDLPFTKYSQFVPAPDVQFSYWRLDPDESVRLVDPNLYGWGYDDYTPSGRGETMRAELIADRIRRWAFPYQIGEQTIKSWGKIGIQPRQIYDRNKASLSRLHLANQVVSGLATTSFGANTATPQQLLGLAGPAYFNDSSGTELDPVTGQKNPNYALILNCFQQVKSYIVLGTNGALDGTELIAVMGPATARVIARSGEMREFLKQSQFAKDLTEPNVANWNLPPSYGGFKLVVDDTVRCFIHQRAADTETDAATVDLDEVTSSSEKGFLLDQTATFGTIFFLSRPGGLDGNYGFQNFSSVQIYTLNGEARVKAESDNWNELIKAAIVMENKVVFPAARASFKLTATLDPNQTP